jgi:hypothetical protein
MAKRKAADSGDQGGATTIRRSSRRKTSDLENHAIDEGKTKPSDAIEGRAPPKAAKTATAKTKSMKKNATALPKVPISAYLKPFT